MFALHATYLFVVCLKLASPKRVIFVYCCMFTRLYFLTNFNMSKTYCGLYLWASKSFILKKLLKTLKFLKKSRSNI